MTLAAFGDSITWPCYHTDFRQTYLSLTADTLRKAYPKAKVAVVHAGNMGSAARGLAEQRFDRHVLAHKPDLVFLMFGMNDCLGGPAGLDAYDRALSALILKARGAGALPVVCTQNEILYDSPDGRARKALPEYLLRAARVAVREKVPLVDCYARWKALTADALVVRLNDWIHPNLAGHRLFAQAILQTLWPKAVRHTEDTLHTPSPAGAAAPVACLLPGPAGKQVVRTADGTWIALTGRQRGKRVTDLVFSWSRDERPPWNAFRHVTLVGPGPNAVFDDQGRTLTAGMLLEDRGRLFVVFSWNVGVFFVSLDLKAADWVEQVGRPRTWLRHTPEPFLRPTALLNRTQDGGLLLDGFVSPAGWPAVFCTHYQLAPKAGWEVTAGEEGLAVATYVPDQEGIVRFLPGVVPVVRERLLPLAYQSAPGNGQRGVAVLREEGGRFSFSVLSLAR